MFQLRVGLSPLRRHKMKKHFRDTPTDVCGCQLSAETTEHFLIHCSLFTEARNSMFRVINPILQLNGVHLLNDETLGKLLLYGSDTLTVEENKAVLSATLKFIHESTRFDPVNE